MSDIHLDVTGDAATGPEADLYASGRAFACTTFVEGGADAFCIFGNQELGVVPADNFVRRITEQVSCFRIGEGEVTIGIEDV